MAKNALVKWIEHYIKAEEPRSKSLIISVFGDSISPYSEGVWLGELIDLMSVFSMSERLVRTSAFRLSEEGWITSQKHGRRSFYSLTETGTKRFESAYQHIYKSYEVDWDGQWTLVILRKNFEATSERTELRKELEWNGFSLLCNGVFLHPIAEPETARQIVERNGYQDLALIFRAESIPDSSDFSNTPKIRNSWNLEEVERRYLKFIKDFKPIVNLLTREPEPIVAFQIQTLMIHSFRRASLHDPLLPRELLPENWPHRYAFELCKEIYAITCRPAHLYIGLNTHIDTKNEPGDRLNISVNDRFQ